MSPEELEDTARKKAADGEVPHLFPSLHHMEVPAMCSHYLAAPEGAQRAGSLHEERKDSDQQSSDPLNTSAQAVKYLWALEEAPPMQTGWGQLKSSNFKFAFFNEKEKTLLPGNLSRNAGVKRKPADMAVGITACALLQKTENRVPCGVQELKGAQLCKRSSPSL